MKKLLLFVTAVIMSICLLSCTKEDPNEPTNHTDPLPTNDMVSTKINKTIYSIGTISLGNETHIIDNMISRYSSMKELSSNDVLSSGDVIAFDATKLTLILSDKSKLEAIKTNYKIGVMLFMNGGTEKDFDKLCVALGCYNPYKNTSYYKLSKEMPLWILCGKLPSLNGMYCRLSSSDEDIATKSSDPSDKVGYYTDYAQGQYCDMVVEDIHEALTPTLLNSSSSELTELMSATKVYVQGSQTFSIYVSSTDKWEKRTNNYLLELDIWNAFSEDEKRNYYYIHEEMTLAFSNLFVGEFHNGAYKDYGWCGIDASTTFKHSVDPSGVIFHKLSPSTTQVATTYSSEVGFNIGGSDTTEAKGISGGVSISNSTSYTIEDVTVSNLSVASSSNSNASWKFALKEPDAHFYAFWHGNAAIDEGSLNGRTTFISGSDMIFSVPQVYENNWSSSYSVHLRLSSFYIFGKTSTAHTDKTTTFGSKVVLPTVK